ncbi:hypothetical protein J4221_06035 [Candidatus Pacearchaeota archaeon]|nr:hypothetical protein [Candidatus Pacearchaeota archaeon]
MIIFLGEESIINISLIGLGLLVALYTIFSDRINDFRENRNSRFIDLSKEEIKKIRELKTNEDKQTKEELIDLWQEKKKIESGLSYHQDLGYFISGILFIISILIVFVVSYFNKFENILIYSQFLLLAGLINFFYIWIRTMLDMRTLFKWKMEIVEGNKEEKEDKVEKHLRDIKETLKESEERQRQKDFKEMLGFIRLEKRDE